MVFTGTPPGRRSHLWHCSENWDYSGIWDYSGNWNYSGNWDYSSKTDHGGEQDKLQKRSLAFVLAWNLFLEFSGILGRLFRSLESFIWSHPTQQSAARIAIRTTEPIFDPQVTQHTHTLTYTRVDHCAGQDKFQKQGLDFCFGLEPDSGFFWNSGGPPLGAWGALSGIIQPESGAMLDSHRQETAPMKHPWRHQVSEKGPHPIHSKYAQS